MQKEAVEIGMVTGVADRYPDMIQAVVDEVKRPEGKIPRIGEGKISIPEFRLPDVPSKKTREVSIIFR